MRSKFVIIAGLAGLAGLAGASLLAGFVLAQALSGPSIEDLVNQAQARADVMKGSLTGLDPQAAVDRAQQYRSDAQTLSAGNRDRLRKGLGFLAPEYRADPYLADEQVSGGVIYIAVSLSMPKASLRQLARDAEKAQAVLVIRGLLDGSFTKTQAALKGVFVEGEPAGLIIDPRVFQQYHVERVPSFISATDEVQPCEEGFDCARPDVPFDVVRGNVSLAQALHLLADKGTAAPDTARRALVRMGE